MTVLNADSRVCCLHGACDAAIDKAKNTEVW